nr:MAG TPA: hypothetical protein [Caudoviricetes sp.]
MSFVCYLHEICTVIFEKSEKKLEVTINYKEQTIEII